MGLFGAAHGREGGGGFLGAGRGGGGGGGGVWDGPPPLKSATHILH